MQKCKVYYTLIYYYYYEVYNLRVLNACGCVNIQSTLTLLCALNTKQNNAGKVIIYFVIYRLVLLSCMNINLLYIPRSIVSL